MFSTPSVFVVGAGASAEYDVAVGENLKLRIAALLNFYFDRHDLISGDSQICETLKRHSQSTSGQYGMSQEHFKASRHISEAMPHALSIDNFVDAHRGNEAIELCAKLGIVKAIINEESNSKLSGLMHPHKAFDFTAVAGGWIAKFFQMLHENVRLSDLESIFSNITIINFNYDRCIEAYLPRAISQYYGVDYSRALSLMSHLTIIHPYGMVGGYDPGGSINPAFGSSDVNLLEAAKGIRTFSEGLSDPALAEKIRAAMAFAETLVFLGFSFHPMNLELLANSTPYLRRVFGTTFGLSKSAVSNIEQALLESFEKEDPTVSPFRETNEGMLDEFEMEGLKAHDFCSQYFRSLSTIETF